MPDERTPDERCPGSGHRCSKRDLKHQQTTFICSATTRITHESGRRQAADRVVLLVLSHDMFRKGLLKTLMDIEFFTSLQPFMCFFFMFLYRGSPLSCNNSIFHPTQVCYTARTWIWPVLSCPLQMWRKSGMVLSLPNSVLLQGLR